MSDPRHSTLRPPTLAEFCEIAGLEESARKLLRREHGPREFIAALVEVGAYADAVRLLAHALPRREAIWWAWSCARRAAGDAPPPEIRVALDLAEQWLLCPGEENRRAAMPAAEAAAIGTPAGCVALAIFLSGGSIAPAGLAPVEAEPYAAAKAIAGGVILAAVSDAPGEADERFRAAVDLGMQVVDRIQLWPAESPGN
ncbi:MAG TPA: hypothetical protein VF188_01700 [Longimicrobiales bacterium]